MESHRSHLTSPVPGKMVGLPSGSRSQRHWKGCPIYVSSVCAWRLFPIRSISQLPADDRGRMRPAILRTAACRKRSRHFFGSQKTRNDQRKNAAGQRVTLKGSNFSNAKRTSRNMRTNATAGTRAHVGASRRASYRLSAPMRPGMPESLCANHASGRVSYEFR